MVVGEHLAHHYQGHEDSNYIPNYYVLLRFFAASLNAWNKLRVHLCML
jgi:hypothetical protein